LQAQQKIRTEQSGIGNGVRTSSEYEPQRTLRFRVTRRDTFALAHGQNVTGLGFLFEMQLGAAGLELTEHQLDATFDRRMVGAVAGDKFLDDGPQCGGRQSSMGDMHGLSLSISQPETIAAASTWQTGSTFAEATTGRIQWHNDSDPAKLAD